MTNHHETIQTCVTYPTRFERVAAVIIMILLILNLAATIRAATYRPDCLPGIIKTESE